MRATDPAALRSVLSELEQAGRDHLDWYTDVVRGIVCGLPPDPDKLAPDADRRCRFGRWYHGHAPGELREHAACGSSSTRCVTRSSRRCAHGTR